MSSRRTATAAEDGPSNNATAVARLQGPLATAAIRVVSVGAALVFLLPLHAAWSLEPAGRLVFALGACVATVSVWSPAIGLGAVMLLLPLSVLLEELFRGSAAAGDVVDLVVMAFAAGASIRLLPQRDRETRRLVAPAALLAVAIVTSTIVEVRALQAITPRQSVLPALWHFVTIDYWTELREFQVIRHAIRWLAWLGIAVYAERIVALGYGAVARRLVVVWFGAGVTGALIEVHRMFDLVFQSNVAFWPAMAELWRHTRLSVLQPDVNAAGSHLLLFLVPAVVAGLAYERRWLLGVCLPPLLIAFGLARSRAAIGAGVVVLCAAGLVYLWRRRGGGRLSMASRSMLTGGVLVVGLLAMAGTYYATASSHAAIGDAARVRLELISSGFEAWKRSPVFGVGLSDYIRVTQRFVSPDMTLLRATAPAGENAHNNFLQIAVELGLPACVVVLWLIWCAAGPALAARASPVSRGMALGILAFLISALFGHPLLVPLVGAAFFVALGLTAGTVGPLDRPVPWAEPASWLMAGVYLGSLLWRW
ncbi:MAG: O-antigen ligase family protein [Acidobacteria bacterium]|nr:O-antigen ligase family protein [Acidobacteriota bacterium]